MRSWWPLSDRAVKAAIVSGSIVGTCGGIWFLLTVVSLRYDRLNQAGPVFWVVALLASAFAFIPFASCIARLMRQRKQGLRGQELKPIRKLAMLTLIPFYVPHIFLFASGVWMESVGRERIEQLNKQASYEYKQRLQSRKSAREHASKVPPSDKREGPR